jgi:hypothetical protein
MIVLLMSQVGRPVDMLLLMVSGLMIGVGLRAVSSRLG